MCLIIMLILASTVFSPFLFSHSILIASDEVGIRFDLLSGELEAPLYPGIYSYMPGTQEIVVYSTEQQIFIIDEDDPLSSRTQDGFAINVTTILLYRINPEDIGMIHARWQDSYRLNLIAPVTRNVIRSRLADFTLVQLQTDIEMVETDIQSALQDFLSTEAFILDSLEIEFNLSASD